MTHTTDETGRTADADPERVSRDRLVRAQLVALNRQGRVSNFVPPVNSIVVAVMLWGEFPAPLIVGWAALVWMSSALRVVMYRYYDRAVRDNDAEQPFWRFVWPAAYALSGAVWGIGSVLLFPEDNFLVQAFMALFVLGMGAGGTAALAPYFPALVAYVVPLVTPIATFLVLQDSEPHLFLGIAAFVFLVALLFLGRAGHRNFGESVRLGIENQQLARELTSAQDRLAGALDSMSEAFALFDAESRLVEHNNKFHALLPNLHVGTGSDLTFEEFITRLARTGRIRASIGRYREWAREVVRRCRSGEVPIEIELADGRWLMLNRASTGDGGFVTTFSDISQIKSHEAEISESEQRFRDFTSAASDWAWELDAEGRFTHVSGRYTDVSGRKPEALIGKKIFDVPSIDNPGDWERLEAALNARQPFRNVRAVRPREDGEVFHFIINGLPIFGPTGAFMGFRGTGTDITAMVRAQDRARVAQAHLFEAIESIPAGFFLFDELGRLTLWNSRAPRYLPGADALIVSGTSFGTLMKRCAESGEIADASDRVDEWLAEQMEWFETPEARREIAFSDGRFVQLLGRRTTDGSTVCVITDITDIRRGQEELAEKTTFLQATLEGMGEGLVVLDGEGNAILTNARLGRLAVVGDNTAIVGLPLREILQKIGANPNKISASVGDSERIRSLEAHLAEGIPFQFEASRIGRQILLVRADPLPGDGWVCVFTDITAERRALNALEESEDRYRRLSEASPDMIAVHAEGRFRFVNPAGAHLLGVSSPDELIGRRVLDFVHPDDHESARTSPPMSRFDQDVAFHEFRALRSDGGTFEAEALGAEFLYEGRPAILGIWRDITERKLAQAQLVQTSKLALLGEMAASMAHELNQPLNIIRMAADSSLIFMEEGEADIDSHREEFERISAQTERMASIINHLRVFSRQEESGDSRFDPIASVSAAATMVREQYLLDGVDVRTVLPKRTALVRGQPIRLEQVVLNLLANARDAIKSAAQDQEPGRAGDAQKNLGAIEVSAFVTEPDASGEAIREGEVVITVSDSGGGIPEDVRAHVFEPFFTTKSVGEGTGLGLAIGYSIVSGMGGTISVTNGAGGAVFEIRLPVALEDAPGESEAGAENRQAGE
ncbi:MAG: PAS-domain containing protein [Alphaproteobacteria bacterium]|nr:PAS-domain containing protein [Alphaproteobacteria bacterium]